MHRIRGVTVIELLVTLSILVILLTIAVPSFSWFIARNGVATMSNQLMGSLQLARSEANRRGARITVCKSSNGTACASTGNWNQGWIVFVDGGTAGDTSGDPAPLRMVAGSDKAVITGANFISFLSNGSVESGIGTINACKSNIDIDIDINASGRVRMGPFGSC